LYYYLAPLEGVTTWVYRKAQAEVYGPLDKYFIPFIEPHEKRNFNMRELQEILPEHNENIHAVPQILTNQAEGFVKLAQALGEFGYEEINLNLGCPSKTVVSKKKGSGFLAMPEELDRFLEHIFSKVDLKISIKTRIGKESPDEFMNLLKIYDQYPLEELIIHPRVQTDYYKNKPRMEVFQEALKESRHTLCYNGDLFSRENITKFQSEFSEEDRVMIGRGLIINPGLVQSLTNQQEQAASDKPSAKEQFRDFHDRVVQGYQSRDLGDMDVLYRMKELWFYQIHLFPDSDSYAKKLKKTRKLSEYNQLVTELLCERDIRPL
jgi:tRNA-dihydrouridine synthase